MLQLWRRTTKVTFNRLCDRLGPHIHGNFQQIPMRQRVALGLFFMGQQGCTCKTTGLVFGVHEGAVSSIVGDFVEAVIAAHRHHRHLIKFPTGEELTNTIRRFEALAGLPNVCGAIDCTHFSITKPSRPDADDYRDRWGRHSIIGPAVVDSSGRFLDVCVGCPGSWADARVFAHSTLSKRINAGSIITEPVARLTACCIQPYLVGDSGYTHSASMMVPYRGRQLSQQQQEFNTAHLQTRWMAEQALGRLKDRWRLLRGTLSFRDVDKSRRAVFAAFCLQSLVCQLEGEPGEGREGAADLCTLGEFSRRQHTMTSDAHEKRERVAEWVVTKVPQAE